MFVVTCYQGKWGKGGSNFHTISSSEMSPLLQEGIVVYPAAFAYPAYKSMSPSITIVWLGKTWLDKSL